MNNKKKNELRKLIARLNELVLELIDSPASEDKKPAKVEKAPKSKEKKAKPKKIGAGKTKSEMRCRHTEENVDGEEVRCSTRSKGPRFRYLCQEHFEE